MVESVILRLVWRVRSANLAAAFFSTATLPSLDPEKQLTLARRPSRTFSASRFAIVFWDGGDSSQEGGRRPAGSREISSVILTSSSATTSLSRTALSAYLGSRIEVMRQLLLYMG